MGKLFTYDAMTDQVVKRQMFPKSKSLALNYRIT